MKLGPIIVHACPCVTCNTQVLAGVLVCDVSHTGFGRRRMKLGPIIVRACV